MPIISRFYNIVIPLENLKRILNKEELQRVLKKRIQCGPVWADDYLYSEGSMNPTDNEDIIKFWESKGLTQIETINGQEYWKDLCLIAYPNFSPTLPCDWIEIFVRNDCPDIYFSFKDAPRDYFITEPIDKENIKELVDQVFMSKEIITIAGVSLNQKDFPKLYDWAKRNPGTLESQLISIANAWHNGNTTSAAISFESDLEHG